MISLRGFVVLLCVVIVSAVAGWSAGATKADKWERWNYAHVARDGKGDRP